MSNICIKQNAWIDHDLQLFDRIIEIAENIALKLLNGIVRLHLAELVHLICKVMFRTGARAMAAFMVACRFA
jgi:hypothetical protein